MGVSGVGGLRIENKPPDLNKAAVYSGSIVRRRRMNPDSGNLRENRNKPPRGVGPRKAQ